MFLWGNAIEVLYPFLKLDYLLLSYENSFFCSSYLPFISAVNLKYFLLFTVFMMFFDGLRFVILKKSSLFIYFFCCLFFLCHAEETCQIHYRETCPILCLKSFIILLRMLRSLIHLSECLCMVVDKVHLHSFTQGYPTFPTIIICWKDCPLPNEWSWNPCWKSHDHVFVILKIQIT